MISLLIHECRAARHCRAFHFDPDPDGTTIILSFSTISSITNLRVRSNRPNTSTIIWALNHLSALDPAGLRAIQCSSPSLLTRRFRLTSQPPALLVIEASVLQSGSILLPASIPQLQAALAAASQSPFLA